MPSPCATTPRCGAFADAYESKYGSEWHFEVRDGAFHHEAGVATVYEVAARKTLGFRKGNYSQTRWRVRSG